MPDKPRLPVVWTSHLRSEEKRKEFENVVRNSTYVLSRLRNILEYRLEEINSVELADDFYEKPNIAERQIFLNARRRELSEILRLLDFTK